VLLIRLCVIALDCLRPQLCQDATRVRCSRVVVEATFLPSRDMPHGDSTRSVKVEAVIPNQLGYPLFRGCKSFSVDEPSVLREGVGGGGRPRGLSVAILGMAGR
jgi:hypothetical protein